MGLLQKNAATIDLASSFFYFEKNYGLKTGNLTTYENTKVSRISREAETWHLKILAKQAKTIRAYNLPVILCPGYP